MSDDASSIEEAAAAAHLALAMLDRFFRAQVGEGAITAGAAQAAWRTAMDDAKARHPDLERYIDALGRRSIDAVDQEEAARFG